LRRPSAFCAASAGETPLHYASAAQLGLEYSVT
jgi:hypothetical protein